MIVGIISGDRDVNCPQARAGNGPSHPPHGPHQIYIAQASRIQGKRTDSARPKGRNISDPDYPLPSSTRLVFPPRVAIHPWPVIVVLKWAMQPMFFLPTAIVTPVIEKKNGGAALHTRYFLSMQDC
jgi:hypothetical protein